MLSGGETRKMKGCCSSQGQQLSRIKRVFERLLDAREEFLAADRLFDEIQRARLHRYDGHGHIGVAGDMMAGKQMAGITGL